MYEATRKNRRNPRRESLAAGSAVFALILLSGCSSVPDAVNPVHWYDSVADWIAGPSDSDDEANADEDFPSNPNDERPTATSSKTQDELVEGLASDRAHARYTQDSLNRQGNPTRPLAPSIATQSTKPAAETRTAAVQPPPPSVTTSDLSQDSAPPPPPSVEGRSLAPQAAAPSPVVAPTPAAAPVRTAARTRPAASQGPESLEQVYARRLAEYNEPVQAAQPTPVAASAPMLAPASRTASASTYAARSPYIQPASTGPAIHLIPPSHANRERTASGSGVHPLADYADGSGSASFEVGAVSFGEGTSELPGGERARLRDVAALLKGGGSIRVIGNSSSPRLDIDPAANSEANRALAAERADTVAHELVRLGVPARRIYAGAGAGGNATEIYIDY